MKVYFLVIIIILVVVIILLFYLVHKIYILHVKSYDDGEYDDEEAELCLKDHVDGAPSTEVVQSSQESLSNKTASSSLTDETTTSTVQPNVKTVAGPVLSNVADDVKQKNGTKEKCSMTLSFQYIQSEMKLFITLLEASNIPKAKSGSSEPYIDMQVTPYKHRTYRPPGFRRPLRGCLKRPIDFSLEQNDVNIHYFVLYLLRYDPFSRLKVDGELKIPLDELENLLIEEVITNDRELVDSDQQFTGFIFRHGNGSPRSLNGSSRSTNGSPIGLRRSQEDSTRSSSRSFNGFSRALDESSTRRQGYSSGYSELTPTRDDKFRDSSRSFGGLPVTEADEFGPSGLTRSKTDRPRRKRRARMHDSPLVRSPDK